jgi:hypothetical protein
MLEREEERAWEERRAPAARLTGTAHPTRLPFGLHVCVLHTQPQQLRFPSLLNTVMEEYAHAYCLDLEEEEMFPSLNGLPNEQTGDITESAINGDMWFYICEIGMCRSDYARCLELTHCSVAHSCQ